MPVKIFCSYSVADEPDQRELEKHLSVMQRDGEIDLWTFRRIAAGEEWNREIETQLKTASIILLLLSPDFFASTPCSIETTTAMERHAAGDAVVIPIVLRESDWKFTPIGKLQALPDAMPIKEWPSQDRAWKKVVDGIRAKVAKLGTMTGEHDRAEVAQSVVPDDAVRVIREFIRAFPPPFLAEPIDDVQLRRVIRPLQPLPSAIYRWRATRGVHWIEFAHFLLLRRLADLGFHIELLIDDLSHDPPRDELRLPVERICSAMFGTGEAECHWLADIYPNRHAYSQYAQQSGLDADASEQLARASRTEFGVDVRAQFWVEYITWLVRENKRCVVLGWQPHRAIYEVLRRVWAIESLLVVRPVYRLDGKPAKYELPGSRLFVEPPHYPSILSWLAGEAEPSDVQALAKYLTLDAPLRNVPGSEVLDRARDLLAPYPGIANTLDSAQAGYTLIAAMLEWNERYFGSWL